MKQLEASFVERILSLDANEEFEEVTVTKMVDPNEGKSMMERDGTMSSVYHAEAKVTYPGGCRRDVLKLFIKTQPLDDVEGRFLDLYQMDRIETLFYAKLLPDLMKFEKEHLGTQDLASLCPKIYCAVTNLKHFGSLMIMEDISDRYKNKKFNEGLDGVQIKVALKKLATLHATSYAFATKDQFDFDKKYLTSSFPHTVHDNQTLVERFGITHTDMIIESLSGLPDEESLTEMLRNVGPKIFRILEDVVKTGENYKKFVCHSDCWANNILVSSNGHDILAVDWQCLTAGNIFYDWGYVTFINTDPDTMKSNLVAFMDVYYNKFQDICQKAGVDIPWTRDEFGSLAMDLGVRIALYATYVSAEQIRESPNFIPRAHYILRLFKENCYKHYQ